MRNVNVNEPQNQQSCQTSVMPRFSDEEIIDMAFAWSSEKSIGDAEEDSKNMNAYLKGLQTMQNLLLNV